MEIVLYIFLLMWINVFLVGLVSYLCIKTLTTYGSKATPCTLQKENINNYEVKQDLQVTELQDLEVPPSFIDLEFENELIEPASPCDEQVSIEEEEDNFKTRLSKRIEEMKKEIHQEDGTFEYDERYHYMPQDIYDPLGDLVDDLPTGVERFSDDYLARIEKLKNGN